MSVYAAANDIHIHGALAFTIYWSKERAPPRTLGRPGDFFVCERGNQLFYVTAPERNNVDGVSSLFDGRWPLVEILETSNIPHLLDHLYHLVGENLVDRCGEVSLPEEKTVSLELATLMYPHSRNKRDSLSPEI